MPQVLLLPGDGQVAESIAAVGRIIEASSIGVAIEKGDIGQAAYEKHGDFFPIDTLDQISKVRNVVCGVINAPLDVGKRIEESFIAQLGLFAKSRWFLSFDGCPHPRLDLTIWSSLVNVQRDITEAQNVDGVNIAKYVRSNYYSRIMEVALEDFRNKGITRITCAAREDFFPLSSGMFYKLFDDTFSEGFETRHQNIPAMLEELVSSPENYQSLVVADLYSRIAESVADGLTGGRYSPHRYVGNNVVITQPENTFVPQSGEWNPISCMMAACSVLGDLGMKEEADKVLSNARRIIVTGSRPVCLGGEVPPSEFIETLLSRL